MRTIGIYAKENLKYLNPEVVDYLTKEFDELIRTLGFDNLGVIKVGIRKIDPAYFVGYGKLQEIKRIAHEKNASALIFYDSLTPVQIRNISNETGLEVLTRTDIIIKIFKQHATSLEAKLQLELVSLELELPKLYGVGREMEQIKGGIGLRGPGETKTEVSKRHIKERIRFLRKKIEQIKNTRIIQSRLRKNLLNVSIVGYTNSGKSTLMNSLSKASVLEEDRLFSTLDTKSKRIYIDGYNIIITDTVGFIEDLPAQLIESFYSTLEVIKQASLLLHVVDISDKMIYRKIKVVDDCIKEIFQMDRLSPPETFYVFNKVDKIEDIEVIEEVTKSFPNSIVISAKEKINLEKLRDKLLDFAKVFYSSRNIGNNVLNA